MGAFRDNLTSFYFLEEIVGYGEEQKEGGF